MQYRTVQTNEQFEQANALLASTGYYADGFDLRLAGGVVVGAFDGDKIVACLHLVSHGVVCDLDYVAASKSHPGAAVRLLRHTRDFLLGGGFHEVKFMRHCDNKDAARLWKIFGIEADGPYMVGTFKLGDPNGRDEDRD